MSRLTRCDRCGDVAEGCPAAWQVLPDPSGDPDPILGGTFGSIDVCPVCQTPGERADLLLLDVIEGYFADEEGAG